MWVGMCMSNCMSRQSTHPAACHAHEPTITPRPCHAGAMPGLGVSALAVLRGGRGGQRCCALPLRMPCWHGMRCCKPGISAQQPRCPPVPARGTPAGAPRAGATSWMTLAGRRVPRALKGGMPTAAVAGIVHCWHITTHAGLRTSPSAHHNLVPPLLPCRVAHTGPRAWPRLAPVGGGAGWEGAPAGPFEAEA